MKTFFNYFKKWMKRKEEKYKAIKGRDLAIKYVKTLPHFMGESIVEVAVHFMDYSYIKKCDPSMCIKDKRIVGTAYPCVKENVEVDKYNHSFHSGNMYLKTVLYLSTNDGIILSMIQNHHAIEHYMKNCAGYIEILEFWTMAETIKRILSEDFNCKEEQIHNKVIYMLSVFYTAVSIAEGNKNEKELFLKIKNAVLAMYYEGNKKDKTYIKSRLRAASKCFLRDISPDTLNKICESTIVGLDIMEDLDSYTNEKLLEYIGAIISTKHKKDDDSWPVKYIDIKGLANYKRPEGLLAILNNTMDRLEISRKDFPYMMYSLKDGVLSVNVA